MKRKAKFVFGIPTVQRPVQDYLLITLQSLIKNLNVTERNKILLVLLIAEIDPFKINNITNCYPEYSNKTTFDDPLYRVRWRTKQNLDFAFLMNYCKDRGEYYIQLEDDIISRKNYVTIIENHLKSVSKSKDWFLVTLSNLGYIGKLIKS
ncbi:alpha-1:3-mannosyl-glycoprotein 4-beta-N-acetylglucosaminyltransferase B-like protein, partial [Leptotrombidium deliense]